MAFMPPITKEVIGRRGRTNKGEPTFFVTYHVYDHPESTPKVVVNETQALLALANDPAMGGLPDFGLGMTFGSPHPDITGVAAIDYAIRNLGEDSYHWEIIWEFRQGVLPTDPDEEEDVINLGGVQLGQILDIWRQDTNQRSWISPLGPPWMSAADGTWLVGDNPGPDIDGARVDSNGQPVSGVFNQSTMNVRVQLDIAGLQLARTFRNRRNSTAWAGAQIGTVVFLGFDYDRIGPGFYEVTYKFVEDELGHARQAAKMNPDGIPQTGVNPSYGNDPHADLVYWVQPFPRTIDFFGLPGLP